MKKQLLFFIGLCLSTATMAQSPFVWTQLADMPEEVANNAVAEGTVLGVPHVYSFAGIDTSKSNNGIHLKAFRYNTQTDNWDTIASLPDTLGKIAAAASTVKNKIYIIGGYHVLPDHSELSSTKVHVFDPETNTFLSDGADLLKPIDDQVQCVWRDSLIFVVSGWSNTGNARDVQIYDPGLDTWQNGTSVPSSQSNYAAFGASGTIVGDTIFFYGGAKSTFNFPGTAILRKGVINPNDPTDITWSLVTLGPRVAYRSASFTYGERAFWLGGSEFTYNYDGIAYSNGAAIEPSYSIFSYRADNGNFSDWMEPYGVMDLRGIAQIAPDKWIVAGGMEDGQQVSKRTFLIDYDETFVGIDEHDVQEMKVYPNPTNRNIQLPDLDWSQGIIYSVDGQTVVSFDNSSITQDVRHLPAGTYFLKLDGDTGYRVSKFVKE